MLTMYKFQSVYSQAKFELFPRTCVISYNNIMIMHCVSLSLSHSVHVPLPTYTHTHTHTHTYIRATLLHITASSRQEQ